MKTDKEYSTNDEVKRSEDFQKRVNLKENIIDFLKENLISITDSVFQKAGYTKNEKNAGEYGDGSKYGAGAVENQYIVTVAGKTKSVLTKKIIMDGKSISSDIEISYKDNIVEFNYLTTEQGFFRGVDKDKKTYTVNEKFVLDSNDMNNLKNELKSKLKDFTEKELGYITNTKIGVADKSNKSTSSVVENKNLNMKKLTIKELFEMDDDMSIEPNSDKIKDLNTIDLRDTNPPIDSDKQLFFDEESFDLTEMGEMPDDDKSIALKQSLHFVVDFISDKTNGQMNVISINSSAEGLYAIVNINNENYKIWAKSKDLFWIENFPVDNTSEKGLDAGFEGTMEDIINVINGNYDVNRSMTLKTIPGTSFSMNEVTTSGPTISGSEGGYKDGAQSGAGGYNTKNSWKKTPYAKSQQKRPKVTHEYKTVSQNESEEDTKDSKSSENKKQPSNLKDVTPKSTGKETKIQQPSNKNNGVAKPESEQDFNPKHENPTYNNTNQNKAPKSSNDDFWTEVDLIPGSGYVPKGMDQNYIAGLHDRPGDAKKLGLSENKQPDLTKKKFFSLTENKEKGINKRYLITEKTTDEYEKERFKKLSNFKSRESIKEAEEMTEFFNFLNENKDPEKVITYKKALTENTSYDDFFNEESTNPIQVKDKEEETIDVEKPGSKFGSTYKFFKSDFLNENKKFILDLVSKVYVLNPNSK